MSLMVTSAGAGVLVGGAGVSVGAAAGSAGCCSAGAWVAPGTAWSGLAVGRVGPGAGVGIRRRCVGRRGGKGWQRRARRDRRRLRPHAAAAGEHKGKAQDQDGRPTGAVVAVWVFGSSYAFSLASKNPQIFLLLGGGGCFTGLRVYHNAKRTPKRRGGFPCVTDEKPLLHNGFSWFFDLTSSGVDPHRWHPAASRAPGFVSHRDRAQPVSATVCAAKHLHPSEDVA